MATKEKSRVKRFKFLFFNVSINVNLFLLFIVVSQQKSISWKGAYPGKGVKNRSNGLYLFFTCTYTSTFKKLHVISNKNIMNGK